MNPNVDIPWQKIYDFTLTCGHVHELKDFSAEILYGLRDLCDFDQSLVYFLDGNGKIYNQFLLNIDKQWSTLYLEYYAKTAKGYYKPLKNLRENPAKPTINIRTWKKETPTEFVSNYIRSRGLNYSLGFALFDINGRPRTIFALDKTKDANFTATEFMTLSLVVPQLNNLHKNFFLSAVTATGCGSALLGNNRPDSSGSLKLSICCARVFRRLSSVSRFISPSLPPINTSLISIRRCMFPTSRNSLSVCWLKIDPNNFDGPPGTAITKVIAVPGGHSI